MDKRIAILEAEMKYKPASLWLGEHYAAARKTRSSQRPNQPKNRNRNLQSQKMIILTFS